MTAGRFPKDSILILITHGLALRIFLMRWFHWSVLQVSMSLLPRQCMHAILTACPMPHAHIDSRFHALLHSTELSCVLATPLQMLEIYNPENCQPIVLDCMSSEADDSPNLQVLLSSWQMTAIAFQDSSCLGSSGPSMPGGSVTHESESPVQTKAFYHMSDESRKLIKGCSEEMCTSTRYCVHANRHLEFGGCTRIWRPQPCVPVCQLTLNSHSAFEQAPASRMEHQSGRAGCAGTGRSRRSSASTKSAPRASPGR